MTNSELKAGVENIRAFIKESKFKDQNVRGVSDHKVYMNEVLDGVDEVLNYMDEPMVRFKRRS